MSRARRLPPPRARLYPLDQRAHAPAGGAFADVGEVLLRVRDSGDVQVHPRDRAIARHEVAEERAGRQRAAPAAGAVDDVGDVALDLLALVVAHWQVPDLLTRARRDAFNLLDELIVVAHQARLRLP